MNEIVEISLENRPHQYQITIGHDLLTETGQWTKGRLPGTVKKIVVVSNPKVFDLYGETVCQSLKQYNFDVLVHQIGDGEKYKNLRTLEKALKFFSASGLKRSDAVIALGGGVVGDLTGLAASIYLRGLPFLQIPTTLLAMIDSSVGGKTAVNSSFGKNLIGTFYQPSGVLIETGVLRTLPRRELTAGLCEAVKQGAIATPELFYQTKSLLEEFPVKNWKELLSFRKNVKYRALSQTLETAFEFQIKLQKLIAAQVAFKAEIVKGDEQENLSRTDFRSRKILNFGHTVGHALEKITNYKYFKHGEAVGLGILVAAEISKNVANFCQNELNLLNDVVALTGNLPNCRNIETNKVIEAFSFDKKIVGNSLQWVLLESIGKPKIVTGEKIELSVLTKALEKVLAKHSIP